MVFKWHKAFKEGRGNVEDDPRSVRPISSTNDQNVEVVRAVVAKDHRLRVRMIAEEKGLNKNAVHRILTEHLHMRKICAKLVPKILSVEQIANRLEICQDLLGRLEIEPNFLRKVKQEMNHGCSTTILRPNGKVRNGTRKVFFVRRKHA